MIFAGRRNDAERFYSAMDVFLLPSLWEGMPLVLLEAQAAGLECIVSENITRDAGITENVKFLPLEVKTWAEELCGTDILSDRRKKSSAAAESFRKKGFDIEDRADILKKIYLSL